MFVDARKIEPESTVEGAVCIVGAGAAGITLARALASDQRHVILLESGGLEYDEKTQALYQGKIVGQAFTPLDADRLRFLGGTTNHWSGSCKPFDAHDFAERAHVPMSGWPFTRAELDPYYRGAQKICQLGAYDYSTKSWAVGGAVPFDFGADARIVTGVFQNSPPTRFGTVYRAELEKAPLLAVHLNANVIDIEVSANAAEVSRLRVATLDGARYWVKARAYVLATGGIENPRLLLNADKVEKNGLGNGHDLVGRCFMDHPQIRKTALIAFNAEYPNFGFYDFHEIGGVIAYGYYTAPPEVQAREELPNFAITVDAGQLADESTSVASLRTLYRSIRAGRWPDRIGYHLGRIVGDLDDLAVNLYERAAHGRPPMFSCSYTTECPPDPQSRVTLIDARDALGLRRVQLDWRLPADLEAKMKRAHALLGEELGRAGLGRLRFNTAETTQDPMTDIDHGHHHMGTTRMHADPKRGVVDADCRVHGKANLYVAGSSVFPTYSFDDPTMTIVALALRLADHLKSTGV